MFVKIFSSTWDASDYCHSHPGEVVFSCENHRFYYVIQEANEFLEVYKASAYSVGSPDFFSEALVIQRLLTLYLEGPEDA